MNSTLERKVSFLQWYAIISTLIFNGVLLTAFYTTDKKEKFEEIDVERINVVEKNGKVRLVIANQELSPAPIMNGKTFGHPGGRSGLIFYNDEGDESGGMGVGGGEEKGKVNAYGSLTFDQHNQDQVIALQYNDEAGRRQMGLSVLDRPDVALSDVIEREQTIRNMPKGQAKDSALKRFVEYQGGVSYGAQRLFVGRDLNKAAVVNLSDKHGRTRLRLIVDSTGTAHVDFLDEKGNINYSLPNSVKKR